MVYVLQHRDHPLWVMGYSPATRQVKWTADRDTAEKFPRDIDAKHFRAKHCPTEIGKMPDIIRVK